MVMGKPHRAWVCAWHSAWHGAWGWWCGDGVPGLVVLDLSIGGGLDGDGEDGDWCDIRNGTT